MRGCGVYYDELYANKISEIKIISHKRSDDPLAWLAFYVYLLPVKASSLRNANCADFTNLMRHLIWGFP